MKKLSLCRTAGWTAAAVAAMGAAACGGGDGGSGSSTVTPTSYVNWTDSANGVVVKDWANHDFKVRASDGTVVSAAGTAYTGAVVDSSAQLAVNGKPVGKITRAKSSAGTQIAVFSCNDGSGLVWSESNGSYGYNCTSSASKDSGGGTGSVSQPAAGTTYVTWNGSANGTVIVDANNGKFKVRDSDKTVVYQDSAVLNGAVVNGANLSINGVAVGGVSLVNGTGGSKIAAFVCPSGSLLGFVISAGSYSWKCDGDSSGAPAGGGSSGGSGGSGGGGTGTSEVVNYKVLDTICGLNGGGPYNSCITRITNTGTVPMSCIVNFYYSYANGTATLQNDQVAKSTGYLAVGATGSVSVGLGDRNISLRQYSVSCSKWAFG